ncbi:MAG: LamG domain-containing protein, partial [Clostridia bacterium]|nr:LamG domain-containing protein [Clostridia bacterium]
SYDESIGKHVITVNGTSGSTVKVGPYTPYSYLIGKRFTFEAYFKVDAAPGISYLPIISAQHNAAFGLTASAFENGKGTVDFRFSDARFRFKNVGFEYAVGEYYHVVAVYNGSNLALYVNGEKAGEIETKNEILLPTESAQYICFGASPNGVGECESPSYCTVAAFNLYSYAMDAEQVKTVYERTTAK